MTARHQWRDPLALTPRERDVLALLAQGYMHAEIARHLGVSRQTIKNHVTAILQKLNVHSSTQAVTHAYQYGLLALPRIATPVTIATHDVSAVAERVAACLSACRNIPTDALRGGVITEFVIAPIELVHEGATP